MPTASSLGTSTSIQTSNITWLAAGMTARLSSGTFVTFQSPSNHFPIIRTGRFSLNYICCYVFQSCVDLTDVLQCVFSALSHLFCFNSLHSEVEKCENLTNPFVSAHLRFYYWFFMLVHIFFVWVFRIFSNLFRILCVFETSINACLSLKFFWKRYNIQFPTRYLFVIVNLFFIRSFSMMVWKLW